MRDQRLLFIAEALRDEVSLAALCRTFGISRTCAYKWLRRYQEDGPTGLEDHSRAPHTSPQQLSDDLAGVVLTLKADHPTWGPRKLYQYLDREFPGGWPAASTLGALLKREGLVISRARRPRGTATPSLHLTETAAPHQVWAIDFKGWVLTGDGLRCYPLTVTDLFSRALLCCDALLTPDGASVRAALERTFRCYGLPAVIRSDNGTPFASHGLGGLSTLSRWWLQLGICPERITPGKPTQNGRHERMHRTLLADCLQPPAATCAAQQQAFEAYRDEYNTLRPHEALEGLAPAQVLTASPRPYPAVLLPITYPADLTCRLVHPNGCIRWQGRELFVSEVLINETIGIRPLTTRHWTLFYSAYPLAVFDEMTGHWVSRQEARQLLRVCEEETLLADRNVSTMSPV